MELPRHEECLTVENHDLRLIKTTTDAHENEEMIDEKECRVSEQREANVIAFSATIAPDNFR